MPSTIVGERRRCSLAGSVAQPAALDESELVERLRAGDDAAFARLVDGYYQSMLHVARGYVASREAAEDVVQETFLGVITGIGRFEGRSSLKTWMFRILVNRARTRGEREGRTRPFSSLGDDPAEPAVDPDRFAKDGRWAGFWTSPPSSEPLPEASVLAAEMGDRLLQAIAGLPATQRTVLELRDVLGFTSQEVCELLDVSEANQRVLLHRARSKARAALEGYLGGIGGEH
jgi:RNA polymerase sigma-70 factor (ECF subfamily)